MNTIVICGRLGGEPERKLTTTGRTVARFSLADDRGKDADGQEITQWYNCRAYDRTAELILEHFGKGKPIYLEGALLARLYARDDGTAGLSLDVTVSRFEFVPFGNTRREDEPADPTPPTPRPPADAASPATAAPQSSDGVDAPPDITDPFADQ